MISANACLKNTNLFRELSQSIKVKGMGNSIDKKIKRSLLALNVSSLERLFANMNVIEGYIDKKPIFLDWLHSEIEMDEQFVPIGFSPELTSQHRDSVKVWLLSMRAFWGDMRLQALDVLNLSQFQEVNFRKTFGAPFDLQWLYLPKHVNGFIPEVSVCWIHQKQILDISEFRWLKGQWSIQLQDAPLVKLFQRTQVVGLDASNVSVDVFLAWCLALQDSPVQWVSFPKGFTQWEKLPDWSASLELVQVSDCPSLEANGQWLGSMHKLRYLSLRGSKLTTLPSSITRLTSLELLDCSNSPIREIPSWLEKLTKLTCLNVASTALDDYPNNISKIVNLRQLIIRNHNASRTVEWLKRMQLENTNIKVERVVNFHKVSLLMLCTQLYHSKSV